MWKNCSQGQHFEGVFLRGLNFKYKSENLARGLSLSCEVFSEAHLPLHVWMQYFSKLNFLSEGLFLSPEKENQNQKKIHEKF